VLRLRVLTAVVGIPLAVAIIYAGGWWLVGATALLAILALREFYRLVQAGADRGLGGTADLSAWGVRFMRAIGYWLAVDMPLTALLGPVSALLRFGLVVAGFLILVFVLTDRRTRAAPVPPALPVGAVALPALFSCLVYLRLLDHEPLVVLGVAFPPGACWLFLVFAACWGADSAAYAVGRTWGRRKLWPAVSPGKTVEGAVAGLLVSIVIVAGLAWVFGVALYFGLALGALMGVGGQLGDLAESKLKRWAGVKDSGSLLPGHGGVLDRFDSLLVSVPLAYLFLRAVLWG